MLRFNGQVYDHTKSAELLETRADPSGLCWRPGHRHGSPIKSGRVRVVEFGLYLTKDTDKQAPMEEPVYIYNPLQAFDEDLPPV